jgi:predicted DNA-binding transcriptional regulator AlpA
MRDVTLLTTRQVAQRLGLADSTLREWRMKLVGPRFVKLNARCIRYDERDIEAYVEARKYDPSARTELERTA